MKKFYLNCFMVALTMALFAKNVTAESENLELMMHEESLPLVYSPNGDGRGDTFFLEELEDISGKGFVFEVVDMRTHVVIYNTQNYENNSWDFVDRHGKQLISDPARPYGFVIRSSNGERVVMRGYFMLIY